MKRGTKPDSEAVPQREIELRIISADDLENVKRIGKMKCYAVAYIDPNHKATTPVDDDGGINPVWNHKMLLRASDSLLSDVLAAIKVDIYSRGHLRDKLVGTARILVSHILKGDDTDPDPNPINYIAVQVWRPSGHPQGILNVWIPPAGRFLLRRLSLSMNKRDEPEALQNEAENTSVSTTAPVQENAPPSPEKAE